MTEGGVAVAEEGKPARSHAEGLVAVRVSRPDEMLLIRQLAEEFHRESRCGHILFSERKLSFTLAVPVPGPTTHQSSPAKL